ncbi:hypothetical protein [Spiroplasma alleghenense]|nr:hypothetical protein [Spiroplasma alleghenense]
MLGINFATLLIVKTPIFVYTVFLTSTLISIYLYKFGSKNFTNNQENNLEINLKPEFQKQLSELIGVVVCGTLLLNFMSVYSFWILITDILPTPQVVIIVVIMVWLFSTIFEYKLSAVLFIFIFINPLLINIYDNSLLMIGAVIGTIHLTFSVKKSREVESESNNKIFNSQFRVLILALIIGCVLFGFFPYAEDSIYIDYYDFSKAYNIVNVLPLLLLLIMVSFQIDWRWTIIAIIFLQVILGFTLGFSKQISSQNYLNLLFFNDELFFNPDEFKQVMILLKVLIDIIFLSILGLFLLVISYSLNQHFQNYISTPKPQVNPKYLLITSSLWLIVDELFFMGEDFQKIEYSQSINNAEAKDILVNESFASLFKTINPFNFINIFLLVSFSSALGYLTPYSVLLLLKFNWITYLYVIIVLLIRIFGRWSDFMLSSNWINFSNLIPKSKDKKTK